ncbi:MAG: hypothetical protein ABI746_11880 [Dermatophilaceae bacterium]
MNTDAMTVVQAWPPSNPDGGPPREARGTPGGGGSGRRPGASADPVPSAREALRAELRRMPVMGVLSFVGVLLIATAYSLGRSSGTMDSVPLMWIGQLLLVAPVIVRLSHRDCSPREALGGAILVAAGCYLVKFSFSPIGFRFPDELQHIRTMTDLLASGGIATPNPALEISPSYPGLELLTAGFLQLASLPLFPVAAVLMGLLRVITVWGLFRLFTSVGLGHRAAGVGALVYATQPHFQQFDGMFVYQTLGLAFVVLCLWVLAAADGPAEPVTVKGAPDAAVEQGQQGADGVPPRQRLLRVAAAVCFGLCVVPTHHVSTYLLLAVIVVALLVHLVLRQWRQAVNTAIVLASVGAATVAWVAFVGSTTIEYLAPAANRLMDSVASFIQSDGKSDVAPAIVGDAFDRGLSMVSVLLTAFLVALGLWTLRRQSRRNSWLWAMMVSALSFYGLVVMRMVTSDGAELYGRAVSFAFIPVAAVVAPALFSARRAFRPERAFIVSAVVLLWLGGVAAGWPPAWERVPHGYQPGAYEASIDGESTAAARWVGDSVDPYSYYWATDQMNGVVTSALGRQIALRGAGPMFTSPVLTDDDLRFANQRNVRFILADDRLTRALPAGGRYFAADPNEYSYTEPLQLSQLHKFDALPAASRLYDAGDITILDVTEVTDAQR